MYGGRIALFGLIAILTLWIAGLYPVVAMLVLALGMLFMFLVFGKD
jgi:hypothetical protein